MANRDVKINIGTTADTSGVDKAKSALVGLNADLPKNVGALDISGLSAALGRAAPVIAGITAAWAAAAKSVAEYAQAEQEMAKLDAALANSASLTGEYRTQLQGLASDLQNSTGIADEKWTAVLTTLTKFGADSSNIDSYAAAVKNLAGFLGGDVEQAAFLFGKAMQGSTEMLGRYGIEVDKAATQTEQLDSIMSQLAQRGGGQLEAQAGTLSGQWNQLGNATSDIFESFGGLISQTGLLQGTMQDITFILRAVNEAMGVSIPQTEGLTNKFIQQAASAEELKSAVDSYLESNENLFEASKKTQEAVTAEIEILDIQTDSLLATARAQKELALAKIEADSSLSKEQKATARADIEKSFSATEIAADINLAKDKVAAREAGIKKLEDAAAARRSELAAQQQRTEAAKEKEAAAQAAGDKIATLTTFEDKTQKALEEVRARRFDVARRAHLSTDGGQLAKQLDAQIAEYEQTLAGTKAIKDSITGDDKNARAAAETEANNLAKLKEKVAAEDARDSALAARLARENAADKARSESAATVAEIEAKTADIKSSQAIAAAKTQDQELAHKQRIRDLESAPDQSTGTANAAALQSPGVTPAIAPSAPGDNRSAADRAKYPNPLGLTESRLDNPDRNFSEGFKQQAANTGAADIKSAAESVNGGTEELSTAISDLAAAGKNLNGQGIQKLASQVKALAAQVQALAKQIA